MQGKINGQDEKNGKKIKQLKWLKYQNQNTELWDEMNVTFVNLQKFESSPFAFFVLKFEPF